MSYDLMVFEPTTAPEDRDEFMAWFRVQTLWSEDHGYDDPTVCSPALRAWYQDASRTMPGSEFALGRHIVYACYSWSRAEQAHAITLSLAEHHRVGFFDVSAGNGAVWIPDENGDFIHLHGGD